MTSVPFANCMLRSEATMKAKNPILCVVGVSFYTLFTPAWLVAQQQEKLPPVHYHITDLGTLGGPFSEATSLTDDGLPPARRPSPTVHSMRSFGQGIEA